MAKKEKRSYYPNTADVNNRRLNLGLRMAEFLNIESPIEKEFAVAVPQEVKQGFKQVAANTSFPARPRAKAIGYNFDKKTLYVVFRDGTWWEYRDCPVSHFEALRTTDSTGRYLASSGLDQWPDMGAASLDDMTTESKTRLSYAASSSARLQQTLILEEGEVDQR